MESSPLEYSIDKEQSAFVQLRDENNNKIIHARITFQSKRKRSYDENDFGVFVDELNKKKTKKRKANHSRMNLRSNCDGECEMAQLGLPHHVCRRKAAKTSISSTTPSVKANEFVETLKTGSKAISHQEKSSTTVTRHKSTSATTTTIEKLVSDHNHNFFNKSSKKKRESPTKNSQTAFIDSSQQETKNRAQKRVNIHQRYEEYSRLSQEEKDRFKTDYTYAHSFSYSPFVARKERFNWDIPNMSRASIRHSSAFLNKESITRTVINHIPVSQLDQDISLLSLEDMGTPSKISSKVTRSTRVNKTSEENATPRASSRAGIQKSRFEFSDDEDDDFQHIGTASQNGIKARNGYRRDATSTVTSDGQFSEEDEDITFVKKIRRIFRTTVLNYFTANKEGETIQPPSDEIEHQYRVTNRLNINRNTENIQYLQQQQQKEEKSLSSCLLWPILFMIPILLSGGAYYFYYGGNNLNNLIEDFSHSSSQKFNYFLSTFRSSPSLTNYQDLSQFSIEIQSLKNEIQSMKDRYQADPTASNTQYPTQDGFTGGGGPSDGPNFDEILNRLTQLELKITHCCNQSNAINFTETIESEVKHILDSKLYLFRTHYDQQLEREVNKVKENLITIVREQAVNQPSTTLVNGSFDPNQIEAMIKTAILKYDADKTGEADYALESAGAWVVSTRCSETYELYSSSYRLFGVTLWRSRNSPRTVIQSGVVPGECWCFKGAEGRIAFHLSRRIIPTAITYEHIPKELSRDGHILSAPSKFIVYGLKSENDMEPESLGEYHYSIDSGEPMQRFEVQNKQVALHTFKFIEVEIKSNHGHPDYTCLYRIRVHGTPVADESD